MSAVFDELQRALDASASIARQTQSQPLILEKIGNNSQTPILRASRAPPQDHHFCHYNGKTKDGGYFVCGKLDNTFFRYLTQSLLSISLFRRLILLYALRVLSRFSRSSCSSAPGLQQFHLAFQPLISKYGTAGAICGYMTCAEVSILLSAVQEMKERQKSMERRWSREEEIEYLLAQTRDVPKMMEEFERAMRFVYEKRVDWIDTHQDQFPTEIKKRQHLCNWVANYELSDAIFELAMYPHSLKPGKAPPPPPVDFVRFNQFHEISTATPDEYVRIKAEEERFGGRAHPQKKGQVLYKEGDSMFIVERFEASEMVNEPIVRKLQSPEEWTADFCDSGSTQVRVFAIDLNGHFSAGFSFDDGVCVFINTTNNDYVRAEIMNWYFDLRFPPPPRESWESLGGEGVLDAEEEVLQQSKHSD